MRKALLFLLGVCVLSAALSSQQRAEYETDHYSITYSPSLTEIADAGKGFERLRASFNEIFRFSDRKDGLKQKIVILADKREFDDYVVSKISQSRNQYIFLKYSNPTLSELVLYPANGRSGFAAFQGPSLNRQLFLQFMYSFVNEPPLWLREGFQAYFEGLEYDPQTDSLVESLRRPWLETAKTLRMDETKSLSLEDLLSAETGSYESSVLYPQAWAFVSFFLQSENPLYQRFLYETFLILTADTLFNEAKQKENTERVKQRYSDILSYEEGDLAFTRWLEGQKTYSDYFKGGVEAYASGLYEQARSGFISALAQQPKDPLSLYYVGLIDYAEKRFEEARIRYLESLEAGADPATVYWALGLNEWAAQRFSESKPYLEKAKNLNPVRYGERSDALIKSMP